MMGPWVRVPAGSQGFDNYIKAFFMPHTYVLYSLKLNKYYIGSCLNFQRRIYEHNASNSKFTSLGVPWELKYSEEYETVKEARQREVQIKR